MPRKAIKIGGMSGGSIVPTKPHLNDPNVMIKFNKTLNTYLDVLFDGSCQMCQTEMHVIELIPAKCTFWAHGCCRNGDMCKFHHEEPLPPIDKVSGQPEYKVTRTVVVHTKNTVDAQHLARKPVEPKVEPKVEPEVEDTKAVDARIYVCNVPGTMTEKELRRLV
ncbi:MAG: zinc finger CCCH domain-containing protein, partial [Actinomycetota bacterium]|nr:zinc finger CCCH domain-containing protein [Actinomycetota bacterium]